MNLQKPANIQKILFRSQFPHNECVEVECIGCFLALTESKEEVIVGGAVPSVYDSPTLEELCLQGQKELNLSGLVGYQRGCKYWFKIPFDERERAADVARWFTKHPVTRSFQVQNVT